VGHFELKFQTNRASPTNYCWCQNTRVAALLFGIKISKVHCLVLSQSMRVTGGRTDRRSRRSQPALTRICRSCFKIVDANGDGMDDTRTRRNDRQCGLTFPSIIRNLSDGITFATVSLVSFTSSSPEENQCIMSLYEPRHCNATRPTTLVR